MKFFKKKEMNYEDFQKELASSLSYNPNMPDWEKLEKYKICKISSNYEKKIKKAKIITGIEAAYIFIMQMWIDVILFPWFVESLSSEDPDQTMRIVRIVISALVTFGINFLFTFSEIGLGINTARKTSELKKDRDDVVDTIVRRMYERKEEEKQKRKTKQKNS